MTKCFRFDLRERSIARARQSFIASNRREGRVMRACRRALIAAGGRDLLRWAYPQLERFPVLALLEHLPSGAALCGQGRSRLATPLSLDSRYWRSIH
jgi:hypothetical protein